MRAVSEESTAEIELSIIIPTHKRSRQLRACIESLLEQERLPEGLELIVVVDGADPETEGMLGSLELPFPLRVVVQDHARQAAARNRGAEEARGRYVVFLDDDVVAECQLVSAHLDVLRADDHIVGSGGSTKSCLSAHPAGLGHARRSGGTTTIVSPPDASRGSATPTAETYPCPAATSSLLAVSPST